MSLYPPDTPVAPLEPAARSPAIGALERRFRAIVFDWDGTAVTDRHEHAEALVTLAESLLDCGVWLVVVTGTNYGHVDEQFCRFVTRGLRHRLLVCTNRGSEVYGFDCQGRLSRRFLRLATRDEDRALSAIAETVRDEIQRQTGLAIRIVYDRLNRRKVDLIPVSEWSDPPKAQIDALLLAVESRLQSAGWVGGLGAAIDLTRRVANEHGLTRARITSDVKHIEVGLTDKGDALDWVQGELFGSIGIEPSDVLVAGDEFGPIGAAPGSDDRLRAEAGSAAVVSVGVEPNGTPPGVIHLGEGPRRFRALLADQVWRHRNLSSLARRTEPTLLGLLPRHDDPSWRLSEVDLFRAHERSRETLLTVANGFLGLRGALDQPTNVSRRQMLVAGLFDLLPGSTPIPSLIPGPDCLRLRIFVDGRPLAIDDGHNIDQERTLDLRHGVLHSVWRHRDPRGFVVVVHSFRVASLADRRLLVQGYELSVDQPAAIALEAGVETADDGLVSELRTPTCSVWRTREGAMCLSVAMDRTAGVDSTMMAMDIHDAQPRWRRVVLPGETVDARQIVCVERGIAQDSHNRVSGGLARARAFGVPQLLRRHFQAWEERWANADIVIEGDDRAQRALRFALYHLISAANPEDEQTSIGARGLTGDAYLGHVFWDTDIFILPCYAFTWPDAARAALMYRYRTLPAARAKAARMGYQGALYAWESAETGDETTPPYALAPTGEVVPIRCGELEQHISADVAYAAWQYWQISGDTRFLRDAGAEIILETARFWASRSRLEADGKYHIRRVIGPDEYHDEVDDNAYTNGMAQWNLERGVEVAGLYRKRWPSHWANLSDRLQLSDEVIAHWRDVVDHMAFALDSSTHVIEQFAGFSDLEVIDLAALGKRIAPPDVTLGANRVRQSQIIKQADVVMLLHLLWDRFDPATRMANFRHYEPRCAHGSSLSPPVHALVAARLGDVTLAEQYVRQTMDIDLGDSMDNAARGIHIGALGGLWQAVVFGFAGLSHRPDGIALDPHLPANWTALRFPVRWRGRLLRIAIEQAPLTLTVVLEQGRPLTLYVGDSRRRIRRGDSWHGHVDGRDGRWKETTI